MKIWVNQKTVFKNGGVRGVRGVVDDCEDEGQLVYLMTWDLRLGVVTDVKGRMIQKYKKDK